MSLHQRYAVVLIAAAAFSVSQLRAQAADTLRQAPGARYSASGLHRFLLGPEYRELWTAPIAVPVLDLGSYAGGLTAVAKGGGQQTHSLRLRTLDGREFVFRSIDKDPSAALPPELRGTVASSVVRDQTSSALPTAPPVVARLLEAAGILHDPPVIVILPDDERLGEFRGDFAGLMGTLEERVGGKGASGHWGGATAIIDSDTLFARTARTSADRVDERAFLAARLFDVLIGDWDRHRDQWRWVRFDDAEPRLWRPVPIDRDQAFAKYDGLLLGIARPSVPQLTNFGPDYPPMVGATWNGRELDRRFLVGLERPVWDSVSSALQAKLSDSVIADAVRALPAEHYALIGAKLEAWLRHRRDGLPDAAGRFYRLLAGQVDIHATEEAERASLTRAADGSVAVSLARSGADSAPYFKRRFHSGETNELRLFLGGGGDTVTVRGAGGGITLRILSEGSGDVLVDSASGGAARFYAGPDAPAETQGHASGVNRKPYVLPPKKTPTELPPRDWGHRWIPSTTLSFGPDIGLFVGGGRTLTVYGFRKYPFASRHRIRAGFATGPKTFRVDYLGEFRRENSGVATQLLLKASGIEVFRFHGFGNEIAAPGSNEFYRVTQNQFSVAPSLSLPLARRLTFIVGPTLRYVSTDNRPGRFLATLNPYGDDKFGEVGAAGTIRLDTRDRATAATRGVLLAVGGGVHPAWWDVKETYGDVHGEAATYLSPRAPLDPTLALRVGGRKIWGAYPFFDAAFIGGPETVRLGRTNRYAGDASAYGSAELRLRLTRAMLVVPTDVGVFGLADVGRVYLAGESSDKWHSAVGGGLWFGFLSPANTLSIAVASSAERTRVYAQAGFGF